jgi:hypothetical protein
MSLQLPAMREHPEGSVPRPQAIRIPVNTFLSSSRFRPGNRRRLGAFGISGSISSQGSSDINGRAIVPIFSCEVDDIRLVRDQRVPAFERGTAPGC